MRSIFMATSRAASLLFFQSLGMCLRKRTRLERSGRSKPFLLRGKACAMQALLLHDQRGSVQLKARQLLDEAHPEKILRHPSLLSHHGLDILDDNALDPNRVYGNGGDASNTIGCRRAAVKAHVLRSEPE